MNMGDTLTTVVVSASSLVSFVCFVVVLIQMFQRGATGMGILCIVLTLCCGIGVLIAFVYGWVKATEWKISNLMIVWTIALAIDVAAGAVNPAPFKPLRDMVGY
jgi:hypothetical protein